MIEWLVLKSPIQRTSQRVKWTSGARDIIFFLPGDDGGRGHFSPNIEILAGDDGAGVGRDILARDDIISGDDQGRGDSRSPQTTLVAVIINLRDRCRRP